MNGWSSIRFKSETSKSKQLRELGSNANFADFIGCSPVINEILTLAGKAAKVHSTVLLIGASGTGKEVIAEGIHNKNEVMDCFLNYSWPGNVRELQNIVERVVALSEDKYITLNDIMPQWFNDYNVKDDDDEKLYQDIINGELLPLEDYEKQIIRAALEKYDSYTAAGKALGITHKTVAAKAQKYGIDFERGNYRLCLKSGT